jgi:hypothetical protein
MGSTIWDLKTNTSKELEGIWVEYPEPGFDMKFRVRRAGGSNFAFVSAWAQAMRPYGKVADRVSATNQKVIDQMRKDLAKVFIDHCLMGWEGESLVGEDGAPLAFNKDNALKVLTQIPSVFDWLKEQAATDENFRDGSIDVEAEAKN